ncbi:MAG: tyrosine-type recombinase/integrase [Bacillus sp. (in: firmicutes)]
MKRKSETQKGMSIEKAREVVIRIKQLEGLSVHSISNYNKLFNDFERFFNKRKHINNLTTDDARAFIEWQLHDKLQFKEARFRKNKKKGVSISSCNTYLQYAKATFSALLSEGLVDKNIFDVIKNIKQQEKQIDILTEQEIKKILNSLDKSWYADFRAFVLIYTLIDTFGRISEVLALKKQDIDFEKECVTFNETKNNKFRIVPITKKTMYLLDELIEETKGFESEYIFLTNAGKRLPSDTFRKQLREIVQKAGIERRVHPHIFRHTSAMLFLKNNGSLRVLQKILGHRDIQTTMIYSHVLDDTIKLQHDMYSPVKLIEQSEGYKTKTNQKGRRNKK